MRFPLVVIPNLTALSWDDRLDRQEESHLVRFEDAALRIHEGDARTFEVETCPK